jgi:hypothetical protein
MRWLRTHLHVVDVLANGIYSRRHLAEFARTRSALFTEGRRRLQRVRASLIRARDQAARRSHRVRRRAVSVPDPRGRQTLEPRRVPGS